LALKRKIIVIFIFLLIFPPIRVFCSSNKLALVIGNSSYKDAPLLNPTNDASDMAEALENLGFSVTKGLNVTQQEMENFFQKFVAQVEKDDMVLFYFSGHGIQADGNNYLLPVGIPFDSEDEIKHKAVAVGAVLDKFKQAGSRLNLVVLDASREPNGLASISAPTGSLIAYSTVPTAVVYDAGYYQRNSVYTKYLLQAMNTPGLRVEEVFKQVRASVMAETNNAQIPWETSSLEEEFYLNEPSVPEFPWPPPQSSASITIPHYVLMKSVSIGATINDIVGKFQNAFDSCGYIEKSFYAVPGGFAIVTRLEQINPDGSSKSTPGRWTTEIQPLRKFSLEEYMKALFGARTGYYRVIIFIFTPHPFSRTNVDVNPKEAQAWLSSGLNVLPEIIGKKKFSQEYKCTALVYEFVQHGVGQKPELKMPGRLTGRTHLIKANLWRELEK